MIIRILSEGQFEITDVDLIAQLNELDVRLTTALDAEPSPESGDWHEALAALLSFVRQQAGRLPDDDLRPSDAVLPEEDATLEDVRTLLTGDGLVPG